MQEENQFQSEVESFTTELSNILSKKGNIAGSTSYRCIRLWLDGGLDAKNILALQKYSNIRSASLEKILLKIVLLPSMVFCTLVKKHVSRKYRDTYLENILNLQEELLTDLKKLSASKIFFKTKSAYKILLAQQESLISSGLINCYTEEAIREAYFEKWNVIQCRYTAQTPCEFDSQSLPIESNSAALNERNSPVKFFNEYGSVSSFFSREVPVRIAPAILHTEDNKSEITDRITPTSISTLISTPTPTPLN